MPQYKVTDPQSGKSLVLTGDSPPTETELHDIFAQHGSEPQSSIPDALKNKTVSNTASLAMGAADPILGLNSLLDKGVGGAAQFITSAGGLYPNRVSDYMGQIAKSGQQVYDKADAGLQSLRGSAGQSGFDPMRLVGNVASPVNAVMPSAGTLGEAAGTNAAFGAMMPTRDSDTSAANLINAGAGAIAGAAGHKLGAFLTGASGPPSARNQAVDLLRNEGIEPPIGATLGGGARMIEQKGESVPFVGGAIRKGENRANEELNQAVYSRVLNPIGQSLPSGTAPGREAIQSVNTKVHDAYDAALSGVQVPHDQQLWQELQSVAANAATMLPDRQAQLGAWIKKIQDNFTQNGGVLDGDRLKGLSSDIRKGAQGLMSSPDSEARELGMSVDKLDDALMQAARRSNPSVGPALDAADKSYTGLVRLNRAAGYNGAAGTGGVFTPAQLASAVAASSSSRAAKATGRAPMQDLSDAAAMVLKPTLPNSGTADRVLTPALMAGSAMMHNPLVAGGMGATMAAAHGLYSRPVTAAVNSLARSQALGQLLRSGAGAATGAARIPPALLAQLLQNSSGLPVGGQVP